MLPKLPHTDASPLHAVMLQVTPPLLGAFVTVAVKSWLPLVRRLAVDGTTATEIAWPAPPGAVESPQAARRTRPDANSSRRSNAGVLMMDPCCGSKATMCSGPHRRAGR